VTHRRLAGVVLAAGLGRRLRPLSQLRPKPLCPVGWTTPLDAALDRLGDVGLTGRSVVAVNAHHLADQVISAVGDRAHVSVEEPEPLGTAGALGALADWLDGRDVVVANGDAYLAGADPVGVLLDGWDRRRPRLLCVHDPARADFGELRFAGVSVLPGTIAAALPATPLGLYEAVWRDAERAGDLDLVLHHGVFIDCGTPTDYLEANLHASGGRTVIGVGARLLGLAVASVLWPGALVGPGERLIRAIRTDDGTTVQTEPRDSPASEPHLEG